MLIMFPVAIVLILVSALALLVSGLRIILRKEETGKEKHRMPKSVGWAFIVVAVPILTVLIVFR